MARGLIHKGDKTTTGGVVLQGVGNIMLIGSGATQIGMIASCPVCKVGKGAIVPIQPIQVFIDHTQAALDGDNIACGCPPNSNKVIASPSAMAFADMGNGQIRGIKKFTSSEEATAAYNDVANMARAYAESASTMAQQANKKNDWKPAQGNLPLEVYHTKRGMNDYTADDLQSGDISRREMIKIGQFYNFAFNPDEFAYPASWHFNIMKMSVEVVAWGEYAPVVRDMIAKFESNTGGIFRSELLNKAISEHKTTKRFSQDIINVIRKNIDDKGRISPLLRESITNYVNKNTPLPKFNNYDWLNGLGAAVHDVYAVQVTLSNLEFKGEDIRGTLTYKIQDHFGLDRPDVDGKGFENLMPYRSWFLLQRYDKYGYKPFISEMVFKYDF